MNYSLSQIRQDFAAGQRPEFLFFWGHQPSKDGSITQSCLSQWWVAPFAHEGKTYNTAEHWMMAGKARLFNDPEMLEAILNDPDPRNAKKYGRQVQGFDGKAWEAHRYALVREGNLHKFGQHEELKAFLLSTGKKVLVEASPYDRIWGIGLKSNAPGIEDPATWKGQNLLGFALMEVRDQLGQGLLK